MGMGDVNRVLLTGTIAEPRIGWLSSGKPELRLDLTVAQDPPFKLYCQVYCYGKDAEHLAETLEAGTRVLIDGKLSWRSTTKAGVKESKMVVTCYGVEVLTLPGEPVAAQVDADEHDATADESETRPEPRPRKRPYPKAALGGGFAPHRN
jgi:single-stranded DNA-binding protein